MDRAGVPDGGDGLVGSILKSFRPRTGIFGKFWVGGQCGACDFDACGYDVERN